MKNLFKSLLGLLILAFGFQMQGCAQEALNVAYQAYSQLQLEKSYQLYQAVWQDQTLSKEDRMEAGRMLSKMDWLFYQKPEKACQRLDTLTKYGQETDLTYLLWARILTAEKDYKKAKEKALLAIQFAKEERYVLAAHRAYARILIAMYQTNSAQPSAIHKAILEEIAAFQSLGTALERDPASLKVLLDLAIVSKNPSLVFKTWKQYYRIPSSGQIPSVLNEAYEALEKWSQHPDQHLEQLIIGLAKSGFWASLDLIPTEGLESGPPQIQELLLWQQTQQELLLKLEEFYRLQALGKANKRAFQAELLSMGQQFWDQLSWTDASPNFSLDNLTMELKKRFGVIIRIYENPNLGMHLGQLINQEMVEVQQFNGKASMQYHRVDHMLSNGYEPWFWDGKLDHGGWVNSTTAIFQVRLPGLAQGAIAKIFDPASKQKALDKIQQNLRIDQQKQGKAHEYLRGLHLKLRMQAIDKMHQDYSKNGLSEDALKLKLIDRIEYLLDRGVLQHEARHAIDKQSKEWKPSEFEYRAKLCEVYFSEESFFTLTYGGILSPDLGGKSAHGKANLKIMKGLQKWLLKNQHQITNFKTEGPILLNLALLSEAQLKEAFKFLIDRDLAK